VFQQHTIFLSIYSELLYFLYSLGIVVLGDFLVGHLRVDAGGLRQEADTLQLVLEVVQGVLDLGGVFASGGVECHGAAYLVVCPVLL
jgi:hypothetical protein